MPMPLIRQPTAAVSVLVLPEPASANTRMGPSWAAPALASGRACRTAGPMRQQTRQRRNGRPGPCWRALPVAPPNGRPGVPGGLSAPADPRGYKPYDVSHNQERGQDQTDNCCSEHDVGPFLGEADVLRVGGSLAYCALRRAGALCVGRAGDVRTGNRLYPGGASGPQCSGGCFDRLWRLGPHYRNWDTRWFRFFMGIRRSGEAAGDSKRGQDRAGSQVKHSGPPRLEAHLRPGRRERRVVVSVWMWAPGDSCLSGSGSTRLRTGPSACKGLAENGRSAMEQSMWVSGHMLHELDRGRPDRAP